MTSESAPRKMSVLTVSMLIVVTTFGFANVIDNLAAVGLAAIPSWILVGFLYFLPLALILAEFASDNSESGGGIYSYMERGLGPTWAFVGAWSYFVANLVYLQSAFSRLPIRASLAVAGEDVFEKVTYLLPLLGIAICLALTWVATRGVHRFSGFADGLGKATLLLIAALVVVPLAMLVGGRESATPLSLEAMTPTFDLDYFSTFAWLLFAVAGAEVAAPYLKNTEDPQRTFPKAILVTTLLIAGAYILASIAVVIVMPLDALTKAEGMYDVWVPWAEMIGLPGGVAGRIAMTVITLGSVAAYIVWMESPIRTMFADVPRGTFPARFLKSDVHGTHHFALWTQAGVVCLLTLIPLILIMAGLAGSEAFIGTLNDLASLSLVVPYVFVALAYVRARQKGMDAPFKMAKSNGVAIAIGCVVLVVSAAGYLGAGLYALQDDPIDWKYVATVYGGPAVLILLGLALRRLSMSVSGAGSAQNS